MFSADLFVAPFMVTMNDREEREFDDLFDAISVAERFIEDGDGIADVNDSTGAEVPLFAQWTQPDAKEKNKQEL